MSINYEAYETVVGLEVHAQLLTNTKLFCGDSAAFGAEPNTHVSPITLGYPGTLPKLNKKAVEFAVKMGLACHCEIERHNYFARKNYFYPDLPKGYQISQYDEPLCTGGMVTTSFGPVGITRVHLEEDTGKLQHTTVDGKKVSLVDFNRSGVPLVEIVTEPDIHSPEQAKEFLKKLHQIVRYLGISDADMEKGSMRLEPNISIRPVGAKELPKYKVEVKNINSFRFAASAITYEIARHTTILDAGNVPAQETRGWDEAKNATVSQRSKEEAADYRYFPEPDIPPMRFSKADVEKIKKQIGELPDETASRFTNVYGLGPKDVECLTETPEGARYFEECVTVAKKTTLFSPKELANWIINKKPDMDVVMPAKLVAELKEAKEVVAVSTNDLQKIINTVISANPKAAADYKGGKEQAIMFLMGNVRRQLPKADTKQIIDTLKQTLKS